jgi:hypothetical protein
MGVLGERERHVQVSFRASDIRLRSMGRGAREGGTFDRVIAIGYSFVQLILHIYSPRLCGCCLPVMFLFFSLREQ